MYAVVNSVEGACYLCVPPDPGIEAAAQGAGEATALDASASAALGACASAAPGAGESALSGTTSAQAFHTFTLDSGASRSFFRDRTTLTPLSRPVAVSLADPSGGPVLASFSTILPCPAAPSGTLSGLYLPSFSTNLVSGADLQDRGVDQFTPASQRVTHCTCARTGRHLATFTRRPGSSLYTLTAESPPTAESAKTLLWHHRFGHPSLPRLQGMASRVLVSGLPRSLPPLPPGPGPTCVPCVEGQQRAAPHSSEFPPTETPLQTLHMDVWGPARVRGQGHERYFLLVVDDYSRYTTVFPLRSKGDVTEVLINSIRTALQYAAHQLNLQPRVSLPETSPALRWTGKVGDASAFRVWGSRAFVLDLSADKLSPRAVPSVFPCFPPDAPGWQFYHPTTRRLLSSQDVTFDESVPLLPSLPLPHYAPPPAAAIPCAKCYPGAKPAGAEFGGAESGGAEPGGAEPGGAGSGGAEPRGVGSTCVAAGGALSRREPLSPHELREWFARHWGRAAESGGAAGATGAAVGAGAAGGGAAVGVGADVSTGAGASWGAAEAASADGSIGVGAAGAGASGVVGAGGATGTGASEGAGVGAVGAGGATGAGAAAGGTGAVLAGCGGAARLRPYFVPLLEHVLGLAERRELASRPASPVRAARTSGRTACPRPPAVPGTYQMAPRLSTAPLHVSLLSPPESSLPSFADSEYDSLRAASPSVTRLLATVVTDPSFESTAASTLVAELVDFAARCHLDYDVSLVAESESVCPLSVGGECALSTDVLEDRQEEFYCFAAALPHLVSTLIAPEGDPDAPDIPTPRLYAEVIEGP
ncbi:unnamed protein product [Closterium sp. NIES-64]|nr:unnamed protein product [Closterium sp. NIES-64]